MVTKFDKFALLMWKNWIQLKRRPFHTTFEIVCPVLICLILVGVRNVIDTEKMDRSHFPRFVTGDHNTTLCKSDMNVAFSPTDPFLKTIVNTVVTNMCNTSPKLLEFKNKAQLNTEIDTNQFVNYTLVVQFNDDFTQQRLSNIDITFRLPSVERHEKRQWFTNVLYPVYPRAGPRLDSNAIYGGEPAYLQRGFLYLQEQITLELLKNAVEHSELQIFLLRFPHPEWTEDLFFAGEMEIMVAVITMCTFIYSYITTIRSITLEKEKQLKECMKIMGLPGWLHWVAWFLRNFTILLISTLLMVFLLTVNVHKVPVFTHTDKSVLLCLFILFACSTITFAFFLSVFFTKANTAAAAGGLIFCFSFLPYILLEQYQESSFVAAMTSSLFTNSAVCFGVSMIFKFEAIGGGIHWNTLWSAISPDNDLTLGAIFMMLLFDTFFYLILALYIEAICPGDFGVPEHWYFPLTYSYWYNKTLDTTNQPPTKTEGDYFEEFTDKLPIGIQLRNLSKTYGSTEAVKNLNLDMYEGHITILLGHNGAGKTTTMSMITGMFPPSSGTVLVNGFDVRTNTENVRDSMGLCLQHNVLFDNLTVYEHLFFFGKLKGLPCDEINQEIDDYIRLLELEEKRHSCASSLSGGMKRKLNVGIAMCGKSKVVILDEPTSGMDVTARRAVWNLLQKQKKGRTVLLTTHFMDEADLLGDRVAIMVDGKLQCCGSSFFLKRKYDTGYYLTMEVNSWCRVGDVTEVLRKHIPQSEVCSYVGSELSYQLSESETCRFENMLNDLDTKTKQLGIESYGISLATLEEVFMKAGDKFSNMNKLKDSEKITIQPYPAKTLDYLTGFSLLKNQFQAMLYKKALVISRSWHLLLMQVTLPAILIIITVLVGRRNVPLSKFPSLKLSLDSYDKPTVLIEAPDENKYYQIYQDMLRGYQLTKVPNIEDTVYNLTIKSPPTVRLKYITAASFKDNTVTAWFNGDPYHSAPLTLTLILNTLYKKHLGQNATINFFNHPLPLNIEAQIDNLLFNIMGFQIAIVLGNGMALVASFYILFYIKERVTKIKHLQFMAGMNRFVFWLTCFLCDLVTYSITVCAVLVTFLALQEDGYKEEDEIGRIAVLLVYFGFSILPFTYLASHWFTAPSTGFSMTMVLGAVAAVVGLTTMQVLEIDPLGLSEIAESVNWILLFVPFYSIAKGAYDVGLIYYLKELCTASDDFCARHPKCCNDNDYYSMTTPGIGRNIIISFSIYIVLCVILLCTEFYNFSWTKHQAPNREVHVDSDVQEEINKIRNTPNAILNNNYTLFLRDVTKYYQNFLAVNGVCLGVKPYECFGLLGVNGAGKTTTFKMMVGDESISWGDVWINGLNIQTQQKKTQRLIGYCPQFDALLGNLTARETLQMFALIRGVPAGSCNSLGEHLAEELDFLKYLDKKIKELSGGNKRKLSTAVALVGDPPILFLDEPTTGMDPATKRLVWNVLSRLRNSGKCIVLTSHSMEECEALCTRLAIMVNGNFKCVGSPQRLKNKFAQGFALTIKMKKGDLKNDLTDIDSFIRLNFPGAELKERYQELLSYHLVNNFMSWSQMFGILERSKKDLNIEDYSLGQCSLEQVFLSFTKHQK